MSATVSLDALEERVIDHHRRIGQLECEDAVLHNRITEEAANRLVSERDEARRFQALIAGIAVTLLITIVNLLVSLGK